VTPDPITGRVAAGGSPQPGATVLALRGREVLGVATTGHDGRFALEAQAPDTLLAKVRGDVIGVACAAAGAEVDLEVGPVHQVTVEARGDVPEGFELQLAPRALADLADEQLALVHVPVDGMSESMFASRPLPADAPLRFGLQAGLWLLYAALESAPDALGADMERRAWTVERAALASGEPLEAGPVGHLLEVRGDVTVVLDVVEVAVS
jgi:hypothetical protein